MDEKELIDFIQEYMETDDFTGGVDKSQITVIEAALGVELPESYQWFLTSYGSGGLFGVDVLGVAKSNIATVVTVTENYRSLGMDESLVVIEDSGEYAYCLDTSQKKNNECPVIAWNRQGGLDDYNTTEHFYEFLFQRFLDAKEAWEEDF
ncbi:SMI1/KNR4 family protein [Fictibacillus sp. S7]|uniref:SMI1/KNR4 family protein n=1 Tax=Fictibacillus sp. S7 TaxID=2212476 RepID=UPI001010E598|nr:SMI1/KNR4 family protein [Fictibacillus sp. S7]RXZ01520.1 SMI1/KNR4 family protein [Fictibacillus sp. S7]